MRFLSSGIDDLVQSFACICLQKRSVENLLSAASLTPTITTEKSFPLRWIAYSQPLGDSSHSGKSSPATKPDWRGRASRFLPLRCLYLQAQSPRQSGTPVSPARSDTLCSVDLLFVLVPPHPSLPSGMSSVLHSRRHLSRFPGAKLPERPVPLLTGADRVPGVEPKPGVGRTAVLAASASLEGFQL